MSVDPREFFKHYVLAPYEAWTADELREWKAFAVANGLNALVDHVYRHENPEKKPEKKLDEFRKDLDSQYDQDHKNDLNHIRSVAEVHKHCILNRKSPKPVPEKFDEKDIRKAGAFNSGFNRAFDTVRPQIGFPYGGTPATWMPLRPIVDRCIEFWKARLDLTAEKRPQALDGRGAGGFPPPARITG